MVATGVVMVMATGCGGGWSECEGASRDVGEVEGPGEGAGLQVWWAEGAAMQGGEQWAVRLATGGGGE